MRLQYYKMMFSTIAVLSCLLLMCAYSLADTPANCSYKEIVGNWVFYVGEGSKDRTIDCSSFGKSFYFDWIGQLTFYRMYNYS